MLAILEASKAAHEALQDEPRRDEVDLTDS